MSSGHSTNGTTRHQTNGSTRHPENGRNGGDPNGRRNGGQDQQAQEAELVGAFRERLRFFAASWVGAAAAEDVAQETLRRVIVALREDRVRNRDQIGSFTFQTARHVCMQLRRSNARERRAVTRLKNEERTDKESRDPLAHLMSRERAKVTAEALEQLRPSDQELLRLSFVRGLGSREIGEELGITPGAARVRKHRALQRLERILSSMVPEQVG